jgi:hypothetical protein
VGEIEAGLLGKGRLGFVLLRADLQDAIDELDHLQERFKIDVSIKN